MLLNGSPSDFSTCVCAVQLAGRTESSLYAIQDHSNINRINSSVDSFRFAIEYAESENVPISCYVIEHDLVGKLVEFIIDQNITCLVLNSELKKVLKNQKSWLIKFRRQLRDIKSQLHIIPQIVIAPSCNEMNLDLIMKQFYGIKHHSGNK